jgi:hypothetical protein
MPRAFWLKVQKVCMQYQRKFYCLTDDKYYSTVKMSQTKKKLFCPIAVKD